MTPTDQIKKRLKNLEKTNLNVPHTEHLCINFVIIFPMFLLRNSRKFCLIIFF